MRILFLLLLAGCMPIKSSYLIHVTPGKGPSLPVAPILITNLDCTGSTCIPTYKEVNVCNYTFYLGNEYAYESGKMFKNGTTVMDNGCVLDIENYEVSSSKKPRIR
jgi:hypothetical protein